MVLISLLLLLSTLVILLKYLQHKEDAKKEIDFHKQELEKEKQDKNKLEEEYNKKVNLLKAESKESNTNISEILEPEPEITEEEIEDTPLEEIPLEDEEPLEEIPLEDEEPLEEAPLEIEEPLEDEIHLETDIPLKQNTSVETQTSEILEVSDNLIEEPIENENLSNSKTILNSIEIINPENKKNDATTEQQETTLEENNINSKTVETNIDINDILNEEINSKTEEKEPNTQSLHLDSEINNALEDLRNINKIKPTQAPTQNIQQPTQTQEQNTQQPVPEEEQIIGKKEEETLQSKAEIEKALFGDDAILSTAEGSMSDDINPLAPPPPQPDPQPQTNPSQVTGRNIDIKNSVEELKEKMNYKEESSDEGTFEEVTDL